MYVHGQLESSGSGVTNFSPVKLSSTREVLTVGWGKRHPGYQSEGKVTMQCRRSLLQRALRKSGADYLMARQTSF